LLVTTAPAIAPRAPGHNPSDITIPTLAGSERSGGDGADVVITGGFGRVDEDGNWDAPSMGRGLTFPRLGEANCLEIE